MRVACAHICKQVLANSDFQLGKTKVFLKDAHDVTLEQERDRMLTRKIVVIQKRWRGYFYRKRFLQQRRAAVVVQAMIRMFVARRKYRRVSRVCRYLCRYSLNVPLFSPVGRNSFYCPDSYNCAAIG